MSDFKTTVKRVQDWTDEQTREIPVKIAFDKTNEKRTSDRDKWGQWIDFKAGWDVAIENSKESNK